MLGGPRTTTVDLIFFSVADLFCLTSCFRAESSARHSAQFTLFLLAFFLHPLQWQIGSCKVHSGCGFKFVLSCQLYHVTHQAITQRSDYVICIVGHLHCRTFGGELPVCFFTGIPPRFDLSSTGTCTKVLGASHLTPRRQIDQWEARNHWSLR